MSFTEAVKSCFSKIVTIDGRARRSEYWYFFLFNFIVAIIIGFIFKENSIIPSIISWILYICTFSVSIRRLHDTGRSGWWWLIGFVPVVGFIILFVFYCLDSQPGTNKFGPNPKGIQGSAF